MNWIKYYKNAKKKKKFNFWICLSSSTEYQTLKLMQLSISKVNDVCQSLLDNLQLDKLIPSPPLKRPALYSAKGIKNTRRHMEDRHIIIDDFNSVFGIKVFVGHRVQFITSIEHEYWLIEWKNKIKIKCQINRMRIPPAIPATMRYSMGTVEQTQPPTVFHICIVKSLQVNSIQANHTKLCAKLFSTQTKNSLKNPRNKWVWRQVQNVAEKLF